MDRKRSAPDIGYLKVGIGGDGDRFNGFTGTQQPGHNHKTLIVGGAISSGAGGKGEDLIGGTTFTSKSWRLRSRASLMMYSISPSG